MYIAFRVTFLLRKRIRCKINLKLEISISRDFEKYSNKILNEYSNRRLCFIREIDAFTLGNISTFELKENGEIWLKA